MAALFSVFAGGIAGIVLLLLWAVLYWYKEIKRIGIPGPRGVPIFWNFLEANKNRDRWYDYIYDHTMKYGDIWRFTAPTKPWIVVVNDCAAIEHILKDNFENYIKGKELQRILYPILGEGIFNTNGLSWKRQRQTASHLFKVRELRSMIPVFIEHANELVSLLLSNEGQVLDMQSMFARFTLDSIGEIAFGKNVGSLHQDVPFSIAFNNAQIGAKKRFTFFWWKLLPKSWLRFEQEFEEAVQQLDEFAYQLIAERKKESKEKLAKRTDLLSRYLTLKDENDQPFSDTYLRDIILNFIIAGRDTTAQTLTWGFYLLSQHPDKQNKLVDEIRSKLGDELPTIENLKELKYLNAVINETLRLYPPVPVDSKMSINEDVLPDGTVIPPNTVINYSPWILGRHPKHWKQPLTFEPERWLVEAEDESQSHKRSMKYRANNMPPFMPFNFGPRTCLGMKMAYLEVSVMMCALLPRLQLKLQKGFPVEYDPTITITCRYGMNMIPSRRR